MSRGRPGHGPFARPDKAPPIPMRDLICLRKWTSALPPNVLKLYPPHIENASAAPLQLISPRYISTSWISSPKNREFWLPGWPDCALSLAGEGKPSKVVASSVLYIGMAESNEQIYQKRKKRPAGCSRRQRGPVPQRPGSYSAAERATTFIRANRPDREQRGS